MKAKFTKQTLANYVRNFVFGVEDSLVSTVGLLSGVAAAGVTRKTILLTGAVLIAVEAFSMAVGSFLSERSAEKFMRETQLTLRRPIVGGVIMFFSYFVSGFIPLAPYIFMNAGNAFAFSIVFSLASLFFLGIVSARVVRINVLRHALEMLVVGGVAIGVGVAVGQLLSGY